LFTFSKISVSPATQPDYLNVIVPSTIVPIKDFSEIFLKKSQKSLFFKGCGGTIETIPDGNRVKQVLRNNAVRCIVSHEMFYFARKVGVCRHSREGGNLAK